jgi:hypothetical protein
MTIMKVRSLWSGGAGGAGVTTTYWDPAAGTPQDAVLAIEDFWNAIKGVIGGGWSVTTDAVVLNINEATGAITSATGVTVTTINYADGNDPLPAATQGLVQLRTGVYAAGREVRGRLFIPGPTEDQNTNGKPKSTYLSTVNGATATNLLGALDATLMVWSQAHGVAEAVTAAPVWTQWAVLRSRRQ